MIVAAEPCDCVGPMINSGWLVFLGTVVVVGPALVASAVRRRRAELPADELTSSGQSAAEAPWNDPQRGADLAARRSDHAAAVAVDAASPEALRRTTCARRHPEHPTVAAPPGRAQRPPTTHRE